jgi:hypothetical protein
MCSPMPLGPDTHVRLFILVRIMRPEPRNMLRSILEFLDMRGTDVAQPSFRQLW